MEEPQLRPNSPAGEISSDEIIGQRPGVVQLSPVKRYLRMEEVVSKSISGIQTSYKAFDTKNGIEVAWNIINLSSLDEQEQSLARKSAYIVKEIDNKYITTNLDCWFDNTTKQLHIITSLYSTLKDFMGKVITLRWRIVKKWCKYILRGLDSLHTANPVIVHRHISCSKIFIDSGLGSLNIGELWLAGIVDEDNVCQSAIPYEGSASYIAPETLLSKTFDTKSDIYAFGMCILEIIAREEPYNEYKNNPNKIGQAAMQGRLPLSLKRVQNTSAVEFIALCLRPHDSRPSAKELLEHPFVVNVGEEDDSEVLLGPAVEPPSDDPMCSDISETFSLKPVSNAGSPSNSRTESPRVTTLKSDDTHPHELVVSIPMFTRERSDSEHSIRLSKLAPGADLDNSENLYNDKGIHDGRRAEMDDDSPNPMSPLKPATNASTITLTSSNTSSSIPPPSKISPGKSPQSKLFHENPSESTEASAMSQSVVVCNEAKEDISMPEETARPVIETQSLPVDAVVTSSSKSNATQTNISSVVNSGGNSPLSNDNTGNVGSVAETVPETKQMSSKLSTSDAPSNAGVISWSSSISSAHEITIIMAIRCDPPQNTLKSVEFYYDTDTDDYNTVASEMARDVRNVTTLDIDEVIRTLRDAVESTKQEREAMKQSSVISSSLPTNTHTLEQKTEAVCASEEVFLIDQSTTPKPSDCPSDGTTDGGHSLEDKSLSSTPDAGTSSVSKDACNEPTAGTPDGDVHTPTTPIESSRPPISAVVASSTSNRSSVSTSDSGDVQNVGSLAATANPGTDDSMANKGSNISSQLSGSSSIDVSDSSTKSNDSIQFTSASGGDHSGSNHSNSSNNNSNSVGPTSVEEHSASTANPISRNASRETLSLLASVSKDSMDSNHVSTATIVSSNHSVGQNNTSASNEPILDGNCDSDDEMDILREIEKLDKESRVAKKTFEQRIQKLKSIQEECEIELEKLNSDYETKISECSKKEEFAIRKRDEELVKAQQDFEVKAKSWKEDKRHAIYQQQQQLLQLQQQQLLSMQLQSH